MVSRKIALALRPDLFERFIQRLYRLFDHVLFIFHNGIEQHRRHDVEFGLVHGRHVAIPLGIEPELLTLFRTAVVKTRIATVTEMPLSVLILPPFITFEFRTARTAQFIRPHVGRRRYADSLLLALYKGRHRR